MKYLLIIFSLFQLCLADKNGIEILSIKKENKMTDTASEYYSKCLKWTLNKDDIKEVIKLSKPITPFEKHHYFYSLPCELLGTLKMNGKTYNYTINAASTIYLERPDTSFYLGCDDKKCVKYFLMPPDNLK